MAIYEKICFRKTKSQQNKKIRIYPVAFAKYFAKKIRGAHKKCDNVKK